MRKTAKNSWEKDYEKTLEDAGKARKWSQQAKWLSLLAIVINAISVFIRALQ